MTARELIGSVGPAPAAGQMVRGELAKLGAFVRRDFLVVLSYRLAFITDWLSLFFQIIIFGFVGKMVDTSTLSTAAGQPVSYVEFVAIGIAVTAFLQIGLGRVVAVIRNEQLIGTLESLLLTPTSVFTIQLGSAFYDLLYVPVRTAVFLGLVGLVYDVTFQFSHIGSAAGVLALFVPVIWGLGTISAAGILTFRRGSNIVGFGVGVLTAASGAYFPVGLLPGWLQPVLRFNPVTITLDALRAIFLGGAAWHDVRGSVLLLLPMAVVALVAGALSFRLALRRELRRGTLSHY